MLRPVLDAFRGEQFKPTVILASSALLMSAWWVFGSPRFFLEHLAPRLSFDSDAATAAAVYQFAACFVLLGLIPALIVKFLFRENLRDYGVQVGNRLPYFPFVSHQRPNLDSTGIRGLTLRRMPRILSDRPEFRRLGRGLPLPCAHVPAVLSGMGIPFPRIPATGPARFARRNQRPARSDDGLGIAPFRPAAKRGLCFPGGGRFVGAPRLPDEFPAAGVADALSAGAVAGLLHLFSLKNQMAVA